MGGAGKAKTKAFTAVPEERVYDRDSTIAIVNLDEGAWIGQEQVYYAKSLMQYNDADFVATSLEEARTALRMGKVGAYMIIPAGFSRTVESVNTSPVKATLTYVLNPNLDPSMEADVVRKVQGFEEVLNTNISYLYVSAVLKEFHGVQDDAKSLMRNDERELKHVTDIHGNGLWTPPVFPELLQLPFLEYAVGGDFRERSMDLALAAGDILLENIDEGVRSFEAIQKDQEEILSDIQALSRELEADAIDMELYDFEDLRALIRSYNEIQRNKQDVIRSQLNTIAENRRLLDSDFVQEKLLVLLPRLQEMFQASQMASYLTYQDEVNEKLQRIQEDNRTAVALAFLSYQDQVANWMRSLGYATGSNAVSPATPSVYPATSGQLTPPFWGTAPDNGIQDYVLPAMPVYPYSDVLKTYASSSNALRREEANVYIELTAPAGLRLPSLFGEIPPVQVRENGEEAFLYASLTEQAPQVGRMFALPAMDGEQFDTSTAAISELIRFDEEEAEQKAKDHVSRYLQTYLNEQKQMVDSKGERIASDMKDYHASVENYNPYEKVDRFALQGKVNELDENLSKVKEELDKQNIGYMTYASESYALASENMDAATKALSDAREQSAKDIDGLIEELKSSRQAVNRENTQILKDFSEKLSYTRLGSVDNTMVYDFMVNPVLLEQALPDAETKTVAGKAAETVADNRYLFIAAGCLAATLASFFIDKATKKAEREER